MHSKDYDFYKTFFQMGYLDLKEIQEACKYKFITKEEYKEITSKDYIEE